MQPTPATRPPTAASAASGNVHVGHSEAQGRFLIASRSIAAGEVVLAEAPSVWWLDARRRHDTCARCMAEKITVKCAACSGFAWCSEECRVEDIARHHACCRVISASETSLQQLIPGYGTNCDATALEESAAIEEFFEEATLLTCVAHMLELRASDPSAFDDVWAMEAKLSSLTAAEERRCASALAMLSSDGVLSPVDLEFMRGVCARDKTNGFALTTLAGASGRAHRQRAYAFYPVLAMANHACMPTCARFDELELRANPGVATTSGPARVPVEAAVGRLRTAMLEASPLLGRPPCSVATWYVALQPLAVGTEVSISYTPLDATAEPRGARLRDEYDFACGCVRCRIERRAEEPSHTSHTHEGEVCGAVQHAVDEAGMEGVDLTYVNLFVIKYCCPHCSGTLAPMPAPAADDGRGAGDHGAPAVLMYECNRCGRQRSEVDFLSRVEEMMAGSDGEEGEEEEGASPRPEVDQMPSIPCGRFGKRKLEGEE